MRSRHDICGQCENDVPEEAESDEDPAFGELSEMKRVANILTENVMSKIRFIDERGIEKELKQRTDTIGRLRYKALQLNAWPQFNWFVAIVIIINSIAIGWQASIEIEGPRERPRAERSC